MKGRLGLKSQANVKLGKKIAERFTDYEGVMSDPNLTLTEEIINLQKAIDDATRWKIYFI